MKCDSVDGAPDHQLNLSRERLTALIGAAEAQKLWALPAAHREGDAYAAVKNDARIFVRRYAPNGRPWNPFHTDSSALTINVALSDSADEDGGELLACYDGCIHRVSRRIGDATVHASTLLHGVTALKAGLRYSLIIFLGLPQTPLPPELTFDASSRAAEAAALRWLVEDARCMARCTELMQAAAWMASRSDEQMGMDVQGVVQLYAAPHLAATAILVKVREDDGGDGEGDAADASLSGLWCWGLRSLLIYARQLAGPQVGPEAEPQPGADAGASAELCES